MNWSMLGSNRRWLLAAGVAIAGIVLALGLSLGDGSAGGEHRPASAGGSSVPNTSAGRQVPISSVPRDVRGVVRRARRHRKAIGSPARHAFPGAIVPEGPGPYFSTDDISPVRNGWEISNHRRYTAVDAGGNIYHRSLGVLGIFRQNWIKVTQASDIVKVPGAGAIKITKAPLGRGAVQTWAQRRGNLQFVGKRGVRGTLHLRDDTVTIHKR